MFHANIEEFNNYRYLDMFIILGTFALALGFINEKVNLIRRFGFDRNPHQ